MHKSGIASLFILTLSVIPSVNAIIISDDVFMRNGGDLNNIEGTILKAMEPQRQESYKPQFLAVGFFQHESGSCTATWLGNTADGNSAVFLTAAHCLGASTKKGGKRPVGTLSGTFNDWSRKTIASGKGTYVTDPDYWFDQKPGSYNTATDIAIVTLPRVVGHPQILDHEGKAIPQTVVYDREEEAGKQVWLVGYGSWGTATGDANGKYVPKQGSLRAAAATTLDDFRSGGRSILSGFEPSNGFSVGRWGRSAGGDSGGAAFQEQNGHWVIVGNITSHEKNNTGGARVSSHIELIKSAYKEALTLSEVEASFAGNETTANP